MPTTIAIGKNGKVEEIFVVSEPKELATKVIMSISSKFKDVEPTFGKDSWSIALEFKTSMALISENESKDKDFDLFYDIDKGKLLSI
jgi:hypothetical protein